MFKSILVLFLSTILLTNKAFGSQTNMIFLNDKSLQNIFKSLHDSSRKDDYVIIDIREPWEWTQEHIANSQNIPISQLDKVDISSSKSKKAIFYCKLGGRTKRVEQKLLALGFKESYCITGGIQQWKQNNFPTILINKSSFSFAQYKYLILAVLISIAFALYRFLS